MVIQKIKAFGAKFAVSAVLIAAPLVAFGGISHANGTVNWTGQGSGSVKACSSGQTPFLHWIFTTGGNSSVKTATLSVGGKASGGGAMSEHGGSWTKDTSYSGTGQPTTGTVTASVTYTGNLGNGHANLVISSGCYGSSTTGGKGGGGGTTTTTTSGQTSTSTSGQTQVLGSTTTQSQVSQVPTGSANGGGGGISDFSLTSLARAW